MSGPVPYDRLRQRVRRHRTSHVLAGVAALNAQLELAQHGQAQPLSLPKCVTPFALAGVAWTALIAGNEYRDPGVSLNDLVEMCDLHINIEDPMLSQEPGLTRLRRLMNRTAYEQFGHQFSVMENIGRTLCLLADQAPACPGAPSLAEWTGALGVDLEVFIRIGFSLHVAALRNGGAIDHAVLRADHVAPVFTPLSSDEAIEIIDRWHAATPLELRDAGKAGEVVGLEKWSLNPLAEHPVVSVPGRYVMPWPRLILDRCTPTGLYFIALSVFGDRFPDRLGCLFERYVGSQLQVIQHGQVVPEIVFGKSESRTVDYFLITREAVFLVEAKAARPVWSARLGDPDGDADTSAKLTKAFSQVNRSARLLRDGHEALDQIPKDRPIFGLLVTLEPFHLANSLPLYRDLLPSTQVPTIVVSAHELALSSEAGACLLATPRAPAPRRHSRAAQRPRSPIPAANPGISRPRPHSPGIS